MALNISYEPSYTEASGRDGRWYCADTYTMWQHLCGQSDILVHKN